MEILPVRDAFESADLPHPASELTIMTIATPIANVFIILRFILNLL
jgi:hypothetical protein